MKRSILIISISLGCLLLAGLIYYLFGGVEVKLKGEEEINLTYQKDYEEMGVTVLKFNKELDSTKYQLTSDNNIDNNTLGKYYVRYKVHYFLRDYELARTVNVVDDVAPVIEVSHESVEKDYCSKKMLTNLKYTAIDNYDGDVTEKIEKVEEEDRLILMVSDNNLNQTYKEIPIKYNSKPKDKFTLVGSSTVYVSKGGKYQEQGTSYKDGCGNKVSVNVKTTGSVDTSKVGEYKITYQANNQTLTRKVVVYVPSATNDGGSNTNKVIYLTFDDGPCSYTKKVLNTLAKYNVKATFFVTHQFSSYVSLIKDEYEQGHAIGVHSYTHNWNIYKSVDAYVNDFNKMNNDILKYTGTKSNIFRFPGGSSNTVSKSYAKGVVKAIASKMTSDGYAYFDWDITSGDTSGASRSKIYSNVVNGVKNCSKCIVLMHDIKPNTVNELDNILNTLTSKGYKFGTLSVGSPTVHHKIAN